MSAWQVRGGTYRKQVGRRVYRVYSSPQFERRVWVASELESGVCIGQFTALKKEDALRVADQWAAAHLRALDREADARAEAEEQRKEAERVAAFNAAQLALFE